MLTGLRGYSMDLQYKNRKNVVEIDSLVFSGGGVLGLAYAGVFDELEKKGVLKRVKAVAGASAGAIISMVLALGYNTDEIIQIIKRTNFAELLDCGQNIKLNEVLKTPETHKLKFADLVARLLTTGAFCEGLIARDFLSNLITGKGYAEDITFNQLYLETGVELKIVTCDISREKTNIHNYLNSPDLPVLDAVHASMSIPMVFKPVDLYKDGTCAVDGGTTDNYPLDSVSKPLGFVLTSKERVISHPFKRIKWAWEYIPSMIHMMRKIHYDTTFSNQENIDRTIFIDTLGIGPLDFDLTPEKRDELIESGRKSVRDYFMSI